jgi:hypothetical protein
MRSLTGIPVDGSDHGFLVFFDSLALNSARGLTRINILKISPNRICIFNENSAVFGTARPVEVEFVTITTA